MNGFQLHPEAYTDVDELWEFIAEDSIDKADRVRERIYEAIRSLVRFPRQGHRRAALASWLRFSVVEKSQLIENGGGSGYVAAACGELLDERTLGGGVEGLNGVGD